MLYQADIPEATRQDLAEALGSPDPEGLAAERLRELDALMRQIDVERRKWIGVQETAKLFPDARPGSPPATPNVAPAPESGGESTTKRVYKSLREYPDLLRKLFDEESRRTWRTADLTGELIGRGWVDGAEREESNRVSRAMKTLVEEGYVVSVKKGQYLRKSPLTDYDHAGRLGFPTPDHPPEGGGMTVVERGRGGP